MNCPRKVRRRKCCADSAIPWGKVSRNPFSHYVFQFLAGGMAAREGSSVGVTRSVIRRKRQRRFSQAHRYGDQGHTQAKISSYVYKKSVLNKFQFPLGLKSIVNFRKYRSKVSLPAGTESLDNERTAERTDKSNERSPLLGSVDNSHRQPEKCTSQ